jgi:hypothetical protein
MTQDFSGFRPSRIWKRLPVDRRLEASQLFWNDEQSTEQQIEAVAAIAGHMKFRAKSVFSLPLDKKARYLAGLPNMPDTVAARALVNYHLERQRPMMGEFLDALGITHESGLISDETVPKPEDERLRGAVRGLSEKYAAEDVSTYLATLVSQDPETWGALAELPETGVNTGARERPEVQLQEEKE